MAGRNKDLSWPATIPVCWSLFVYIWLPITSWWVTARQPHLHAIGCGYVKCLSAPVTISLDTRGATHSSVILVEWNPLQGVANNAIIFPS